MASSPTSRLAPACALALLLLSSPARANFDECVAPDLVPDEVLVTIVSQAGFDFGGLAEPVCNGVVKKGASTCKAQVKAADKCFRRAYDTNYAVAVKQCQQLETPGARAECKAEFKAIRDVGKAESRSAKDDALDACANAFADLLRTACLVGPPG
jgi:hypothetical protein